MKLFYSPGACSVAPHLVLLETGLPFELERVDMATHRTVSGRNYLEINPPGYVPTLELSDGQIITEVPVILQYLGDIAPAVQLIPAAGTMARYRLMSWLNFITSEIHKGFGPLFADDTPIHYKPALKDRLRKRFGYIAEHLDISPYLMGEQFSIVDPHLWVMIKWTRMVGIDPDQWPSIIAFEERIGSRPSAQQALQEEELAW
jgi:glutathione S-transferase